MAFSRGHRIPIYPLISPHMVAVVQFQKPTCPKTNTIELRYGDIAVAYINPITAPTSTTIVTDSAFGRKAIRGTPTAKNVHKATKGSDKNRFATSPSKSGMKNGTTDDEIKVPAAQRDTA